MQAIYFGPQYQPDIPVFSMNTFLTSLMSGSDVISSGEFLTELSAPFSVQPRNTAYQRTRAIWILNLVLQWYIDKMSPSAIPASVRFNLTMFFYRRFRRWLPRYNFDTWYSIVSSTSDTKLNNRLVSSLRFNPGYEYLCRN